MNIVIFGAPGSGKGTQSERLIDRYGLHHISTGELLRDHIARGTRLGKIADTYISQGQLIPDQLMLEVLGEIFKEQPETAARGVIFDGFSPHHSSGTGSPKDARRLWHRGTRSNRPRGRRRRARAPYARARARQADEATTISTPYASVSTCITIRPRPCATSTGPRAAITQSTATASSNVSPVI